ncbi:hypothetical protein PIB30_039502 [Stylosanthes scabra]|uniref:non-specific serine/threonine protein kinase n=1 Tax=Stylosanthes scabra TaxID=79078 RepID=A0ABU6ZD16_9FABA|nr:hypothetical protein [Stylosanthes scabra]
MDKRVLIFLLLIFSSLLAVAARTANQDYQTLLALKNEWQNTPPDWDRSNDPCGDRWVGIGCINGAVTSITLASMNLRGQLSSEIGRLSELRILDLSYNKNLTGPLPIAIGNLRKLTNLILADCGFSGVIPDTIGNLQRLAFLSLNSNNFNGQIPATIGNLTNLSWLDLAENQLEGPIPISNGTSPGLDMLHHTKHFHFGANELSGNIPPQLFSSDMSLIHVLFEGNKFTGNVPSTLGLVQSLEVLRLDGNFLSGLVPANISNLKNLRDLLLSNNRLSGPLPNLSGMNILNFLDVSNNSFDPSEFPLWLTNLSSLTTLAMENIQLQGNIPVSFFSLSQLQTVNLKDNQLNGTLDIGTTISNQLEIVDLQTNYIDKFNPEINVSKVEIRLVDNPVCGGGALQDYCSIPQQNNLYTTPLNNCVPVTCSTDQKQSPNCKCAYPYTGTLTFRAPSFSDLQNQSVFALLESSMMRTFHQNNLPVDTVSVSNPRKVELYLDLSLEVFPSGQDRFNRTGIINIGFVLSNQSYKPPAPFGPFIFLADNYENYMDDSVLISSGGSKKSSNTGIIAGVAGGIVLVILLIIAGVYVLYQKNKAKRAKEKNNPFAKWEEDASNTSIPQLKGARHFTFEEIQNYTKNFSQANGIGSGGYGKVYRGTLQNGQLIAVKRAQKESMQGGLEFKTEIEMLSRVHHKNLVSLIGFCFEQGEQMLIYEYVPNGTLKDTLSGKSGIRLDWIRRLKIALGAARGLDYLHEHADPPIVHRDIKSTNILLDERLNAKVSDFGLSKPLGDGEKGYVTTQVKGTMGYLDPEYYMTQQLTEKSDVYSFGVLMLELITARMPIERGKYIVKVVKNAIDKDKEFYGLKEVLDPSLDLGTTPQGFDKFVDVAMQCVDESSSSRPSMNFVVKEIEKMLQLAGSNPNAESASTSSSYEVSKGSSQHPYNNELFDSSVVIPRP